MNRWKTELTHTWCRALERARGSVTAVIVWTCLVAFVLVFLLDLTGVASKRRILEVLGFSYVGVVRRFWLHQFITAAFLHGGLVHLLFNVLTLWMLGPSVERLLGRNRYLFFSALCAVCGFTGFLLFTRGSDTIAIGYSGVIYGILVAQAIYWPNNRLYFFGLFPLRMKHAVLILGVISLYLTVSPGRDGVAHAGHLFGALGALVYLKLPGIRQRWRHRRMPEAAPPEDIPIPEPPPLPDWGQQGELLARAIEAVGNGRYVEARQLLDRIHFPKKAARVTVDARRLLQSVKRYVEDPDERVGENMQDCVHSLWNQLMRHEMYVALPALAGLGLQYGDGIVPLVLDALCSPISTRMPTSIRQPLESSLDEAGGAVLERIIPPLIESSTPAQRAAELVLLLCALNLRKHAATIMKYHGQADSQGRNNLVTRLSGIREHSPGALCDLLAGALTRLPPDLRLARDLQAKVGLRELEKIAVRWAAGGHKGAQTALERLYATQE